LLACLAVVGAALGLALGRDWWRPVALIAAAVSQLLIVLWWPDARAGTPANLLIVAAVAWQPGRALWRDAPRASTRA
jgi:hypothetical protein